MLSIWSIFVAVKSRCKGPSYDWTENFELLNQTFPFNDHCDGEQLHIIHLISLYWISFRNLKWCGCEILRRSAARTPLPPSPRHRWSAHFTFFCRHFWCKKFGFTVFFWFTDIYFWMTGNRETNMELSPHIPTDPPRIQAACILIGKWWHPPCAPPRGDLSTSAL